MSDGTRKDKIRNKYVKDSIDIDSVQYEMNRLRWYGNVIKKEQTEAVIVVMIINIEGRRGREN